MDTDATPGPSGPQGPSDRPTGPLPTAAALTDRLAQWLYMNTTTSRRAAGPASSALVDNLDRLGVLMTADVPRLTVPVPTTHAEANAVWADYMALRRAAGVMRGQRLHGAAQQLDDVANVLKYRHDQWTKAERDAARERISTSREGN